VAKYLVTGAAGFIGFRVAQMLLAEDHTVIGVDNLNDAYDVRMKSYRLNLLRRERNFNFYQVDICNFVSMHNVFTELPGQDIVPFDAVINLAARAGVRQSVIDPWAYVNTNITGTLNLLELCRKFAVNKFVFASTSSIYGANAPLPTAEDAASDQPLQPYAASKKGAEVLCHSYHFLYGLDITVFRYFTVYGPAPRPDMVMYRFTHWLQEGLPLKVNGDGEQSRGFTYIDDIARGTILGLKPIGYEVINLGGHEVVKINELIHLLEVVSGKKAKVEYISRHSADMLANWADVRKAKQLLDWEPKVSLSEGITNLVKWYTSEQNWASQVSVD
jgi:UDP-glucuronate 4-epimerase